MLAAIDEARDAFTKQVDLVGPALARDAVTAIADAGDRVIDCTTTDWWAASRLSRAAPDRAAACGLPVPPDLGGPCRPPRRRQCPPHHHRSGRPRPSALRPDLPDDEPTGHDSIHTAALTT